MGTLIHKLLFLTCLPWQEHAGHMLPSFFAAGDAVHAVGSQPSLWWYQRRRPPLRLYTLLPSGITEVSRTNMMCYRAPARPLSEPGIT